MVPKFILAAALVATTASAETIHLQLEGRDCTAELSNLRCPAVGAPTPAATRTPMPTPVGTSVPCPPGALNLDRPLETNPTLRGYAGVAFNGQRTFRYCVRTTAPGRRAGGHLGAAWFDSGGQCSLLQLRLVSFNGQPVQGGSSGWSGTPSLPYKLLFPGQEAPPGQYYFELDADARACPGQAGRFQLIWTP